MSNSAQTRSFRKRVVPGIDCLTALLLTTKLTTTMRKHAKNTKPKTTNWT